MQGLAHGLVDRSIFIRLGPDLSHQIVNLLLLLLSLTLQARLLLDHVSHIGSKVARLNVVQAAFHSVEASLCLRLALGQLLLLLILLSDLLLHVFELVLGGL